ncbi:hypothetical protein TSAR_013456 [Trichomalopsis sarcophagae]|uniref:F-box domain-containing protein n=1 Tax=Trichomalopsis sarcophagae TaxID=543379 RepID=A0A232F1M3_9HYME|nr:hypothetical protein TSAR_013456 [Trichomalopsis sarcophagae]
MELHPANKWPWVLRPRRNKRVTTASKDVQTMEQDSSEMSFLGLPLDVQLEILKYLGPRDLLVLRKLSKGFEKLLQNRTIWKAYEIWMNDTSTADVIEDLKRMPLLRSISIRNRVSCDLILRQISVSNKRVEHLAVIDCTGDGRINLASGYLTRILERCLKLRSFRLKGAYFCGIKFYRLLGAAVPRLREFHVDGISYNQLVAFVRQIESRTVVESADCPYSLKFETYLECARQTFRDGTFSLCNSFDFVVEKRDTLLSLYKGCVLCATLPSL